MASKFYDSIMKGLNEAIEAEQFIPKQNDCVFCAEWSPTEGCMLGKTELHTGDCAEFEQRGSK
jgi:hypothetical protein